MPSTGKIRITEFNPHTIIIPPGRCPTHGIPRRDSSFLPSHSSSLGETAACGVLLPLGWEQGVESPRTIPHQVLPRSRFAGKRVHGFDAYFPHLRRKRLQPFPQTFATALANVCNPGRKRMHPKPQKMPSLVHPDKSVRMTPFGSPPLPVGQ